MKAMEISLITQVVSTMKTLLQLRRKGLMALLLTPLLSCTMAKEPSKNTFSIDKNIRAGQLPNGFTYYIKPTFDTDKINLRFYVKVGALNESQLKTEQYAHLIEHLGATERYLEAHLQSEVSFKRWHN